MYTIEKGNINDENQKKREKKIGRQINQSV